MRDTTRLGDLAELEVTVALIRAGKRLLKPLSAGCRYDLAIDDGDGRITRLQCKSGVLRSGRVTFRTSSMTATSPGRTYRGDADAFGVFCAQTSECYLVPMAVIHACGTMASLRVVPSRNGQRRGVRPASEFRIGGAIRPRSRFRRRISSVKTGRSQRRNALTPWRSEATLDP